MTAAYGDRLPARHGLVFTYTLAGRWLVGCSCGWELVGTVPSFDRVDAAHQAHRADALGVTS